MVSGAKFGPESLYSAVVFQFRVGFCHTVSISDKVGYQVGENHGNQAFLLVVRTNAHQIKVNLVVLAHGLEQVDETEGEEPTVGFLESFCQRR